MGFARTILGDLDTSELGVVYAHEHLVIHGGRPVQLFPDFELSDVDKAVAELAPAQALGLRTVVDAMPADCGRDVLLLAEIARRSGVHVIAPTGLHHERYYHDRHWSAVLPAEDLSDLFVADVEEGIDELDYAAPIVSVSLGLPATFIFGGAKRSDKTQRYRLQHGDVVVWGGPSRLFFHGVAPLADGEHPLLGRQRINLTFRKAR